MRKIGTLLAIACVGAATLLLSPEAMAATPGYFTWRNNRSNECLDQNWSGGVEGHTALVYPCNGGTNQSWETVVQPDGSRIVRNLRSQHCLQQQVGTNIVQVQICSTTNTYQRWYMVRQSNGTWTFRNAASGLFLDQDYSGGTPHINALAWPATDTPNQYWY